MTGLLPKFFAGGFKPAKSTSQSTVVLTSIDRTHLAIPPD
jgi:hypothetical protein